MGKTYTALREMIKIGFSDPTVHLVIIINKDGRPNDATYDVLKPMFQIPVVFMSYDNAEDYVRQILQYKELYNTVKKKHLEDAIEDDQVEDMETVLHIDDLSQPFLNTIIYFEDCTNSKLFKKTLSTSRN
jgi:hypothetical protein